MINELSTKTLARKTLGDRNHHRAVGFSHQACRLLHCRSITSNRNYWYANNSRSHCLPHLETKARLKLVRKEGYHG